MGEYFDEKRILTVQFQKHPPYDWKELRLEYSISTENKK